MSTHDWLVRAVRLNTVGGSCDVARCNLPTAVLSLTMIVAMLLISTQSGASPVDGSATVAGVIDDMWLESDRCFFRISIYWSDSISFDGRSVDAIATFFNESSERYQTVPSSQGWRIGDEVNATLNYTWSEWGAAYWIRLTSKSDENYAEPLSYFERHPFLFNTLLIIVSLVLLSTILFLFVRRRSRKPEGSDYLQYGRRI